MRIGFENWDEAATAPAREAFNHEPISKDGVPFGIQTLSAVTVGAFGLTVVGGIVFSHLSALLAVH
jgi:hypothetical protein